MSKLRHVYYNLFTICLQVNSDLYCGFLGYCANQKAVICPVRGKLLRDVEAAVVSDDTELQLKSLKKILIA